MILSVLSVIFNNVLYKQTDGVAMECPLRSSLPNIFLTYMNKIR